jgi:sorbitol/mannitol transport system substrate-binding protein
MKRYAFPLFAAVSLAVVSAQPQQKAVTIGVVNNSDMIELKKLSTKFEQKNPGIKLNWVICGGEYSAQRVRDGLSSDSLTS